MTRGEYLFFMYVMRNRRRRRNRRIKKYKRRTTKPTLDKRLQYKANELEAKRLERRKNRTRRELNKYEKVLGTVGFVYPLFLLVTVFIFPPVVLTFPIFCIVLAVMVHRYRKKYPNWKERNILYNRKKDKGNK